MAAGRPQLRTTPLGRFSFRHVKVDLLYGYRSVEVGPDQEAFVAVPEKALLDLVHLTPGGDGHAHLAELRLDLSRLDGELLDRFADVASRPKLRRAARRLQALADEQVAGTEVL